RDRDRQPPPRLASRDLQRLRRSDEWGDWTAQDPSYQAVTTFGERGELVGAIGDQVDLPADTILHAADAPPEGTRIGFADHQPVDVARRLDLGLLRERPVNERSLDAGQILEGSAQFGFDADGALEQEAEWFVERRIRRRPIQVRLPDRLADEKIGGERAMQFAMKGDRGRVESRRQLSCRPPFLWI